MEVDAPEKYVPMEYNDVLAADGIYYATWSVGEAKPYTNEDGDDAEIFDTQVYFVLSEKTSPENAQAEVKELMELAQSRYQVESSCEEAYDARRTPFSATGTIRIQTPTPQARQLMELGRIM